MGSQLLISFTQNTQATSILRYSLLDCEQVHYSTVKQYEQLSVMIPTAHHSTMISTAQHSVMISTAHHSVMISALSP